MADLNDSSLLREYTERQSESAFHELVRRHLNFVYSVAMRYVGNPADAQDVAQAVFVILARKSARLCGRTTLTGWLYETTRLTARQLLRTKTRRLAREQEAYMESNLDQCGSEELWHQLAPHLEEAMSRLRAADRELLALRFYENKTGEEAAALLGIGAAAAYKRTNRALEKLEKFFASRGVTSTTAAIAGAVSANSMLIAPAGLAKTISSAAIVKGAVASTSTLTLIKGALKIMAWTKTTTTTVVGVGVLLAVGTATVHHLTARDAWRIPHVTAQIVQNAPSQVRILPTKFPGGNEWVQITASFDKFVGINVTVAEMIGMAYRDGDVPVPAQRIVFTTATPRERYDFAAIVPHGASVALQRELKAKLGYVARRETRDVDAGVLQLRVKRAGAPGLKQTTGNPGDINGSGGNGLSKLKCDNQPLSTVANVLGQILNATVVDRTDLTGQYSFELTYNEIDGKDPHHDALKRALADQLGLELAPDHEPVEMLVVDKVK